MDVLHSLVSFIVVIGVLVTVHEYGHFWVARRLGVKVLRFSIGFGKPLWSRRAGQDNTEYVLAAIPLGGYVKMLDEREGDVAPHEQHRAFNRQSIKVRTAIVLAGPIANFILTIIAYWCVFMVGVNGPRALVGEVDADSIAARAGLNSGVEIISVAGRDTKTWESVVHEVLGGVLDEARLPIRMRSEDGSMRDGALELNGLVVDDLTEGKFFTALGMRPAQPHIPAVIGHIEPGGAAAEAGLRADDEVLAVDTPAGERVPINHWGDWVTVVRAHPEQTLRVEVSRSGQITPLQMRPAAKADGEQTIGFIGAGAADPGDLLDQFYATERYGPLESVGHALQKSYDITVLTLSIFWKMLQLEVSVKNLSGPISIAQYAGDSAESGLSRFLQFLAIVSVSLGILNLLPVPILDGGHLVFFFAEWIKGRPVSEQAQIFGQQVGIVLLVGLMGLS
ncbi:MAG: RIP metalloprotease RseP, partial [Pseudomonadota bacterium]